MDFSYIYDKAQQDHIRFMKGQIVSEEEVVREIGPPGEWRILARGRHSPKRPRKAATEIHSLLAKTSKWRIGSRALNQLLA
jgi:hypothetical protein